MEYIIADEVLANIEKRGLKVDDVKSVIEGAGDDRIYNGSVFIAKKEIGDLTVYARYAVDGDKVTVALDAHKIHLFDPRMNLTSVKDYVEQNEIDSVVVLYSISNFTATGSNLFVLSR